MKPMFYILNENKEVVSIGEDAMEWARQFEGTERRVDDTLIVEKDNTRVSTVFLGLDHRFGTDQDQPPIVFETMTFSDNPDLDEYQERYCTYDEAVKGHNRIVEFIKNDIPLKEARKKLTFNLTPKRMRRLVLGDIHGEIGYLKEVLEKANFDYDNDLLIQIGDIVDRGPEPFLCMDELLKIKNLILIVGNHDQTFRKYTDGKINLLAAYPSNGVQVTEEKWKNLTEDQQFYYKTKIFEKQVPFHLTEDNICFVHGGLDPSEPVEIQHEDYLTWDRDLVNAAFEASKQEKSNNLHGYKHVFIGHTPTLYYNLLTPFTGGGVTNVDTGSGKGGPLTIMDIDTGQYWQSDYSQQIKEYVILQKNKSASVQEGKEEEEERTEKIAA
jgi:serine/threonine protein phosphatase 1